MPVEVTGDPVIAKLYRETQPKPPVERIVRTDILATILNREKRRWPLGKRVVDLECGHKAITKNATRVGCVVCHEMMLSGEDYAGYRFPGGEG